MSLQKHSGPSTLHQAGHCWGWGKNVFLFSASQCQSPSTTGLLSVRGNSAHLGAQDEWGKLIPTKLVITCICLALIPPQEAPVRKAGQVASLPFPSWSICPVRGDLGSDLPTLSPKRSEIHSLPLLLPLPTKEVS